MRFSLITATLGRRAELHCLFESLAAQSCHDFELVVVDQNTDDRLAAVVAAFSDKIAIRHVRTELRGLSRARNAGLAGCTGEIIGFPDDDCVYPPDVLQFVSNQFAADASLELLSGPAISPNGIRGSGRWTKTDGAISLANVWTSVIAFNFFIRRDRLQQISGFDESLGVGAAFGSAEETDLAIRAIKLGGKAYYNTRLNVIHPEKQLTPEATSRAYDYGTGLGRVLRRHGPPLPVTLSFFLRPLGGVVVNLARYRLFAARYYWKTLRGRISGFMAD